MLKCDTLGIDTGRNVAAVPVPFSGLVTGESQTLGFDLVLLIKESILVVLLQTKLSKSGLQMLQTAFLFT